MRITANGEWLMAKVGIYGGSFNPIHFGHVGLARWVIEHTDLDELWLMVTPNNPLKPADSLAPEEERLLAAREAVRDIPGVRVSDFEFSLPRPSYTAATLRALEARYPEHEFALVIGEDNLRIADCWREWDWIAANHTIYVYPRHDQSPQTNHHSPITNAKNIHFLASAPYFDISSTQLRNSHL